MPRVSGSAWPWLLADDSDAIVGIRSGNVDQLFVFSNDDALNIDMSNLAATWNSAGTTFNAIKMNVTDTASAAASLLLDLQVGGTSQFRVSKGGAISVESTIELGHASDTTLARGSAGVLTVEGNTVYTSSNLPGTAITWTATQTFNTNIVLGGAQSFHVRNTSGGFNGSTQGAQAFLFSDNVWYFDNYQGGGFTFRSTSSATFGVWTPSTFTHNSNTVYHAGNLPSTAITWTANQTLSNVDLVLATGAGTKIGTATNQKLGFFNATPVVQPTAVADATDAASVITQLNALLSRMRNLGLIAT